MVSIIGEVEIIGIQFHVFGDMDARGGIHLLHSQRADSVSFRSLLVGFDGPFDLTKLMHYYNQKLKKDHIK